MMMQIDVMAMSFPLLPFICRVTLIVAHLTDSLCPHVKTIIISKLLTNIIIQYIRLVYTDNNIFVITFRMSFYSYLTLTNDTNKQSAWKGMRERDGNWVWERRGR